MAEDRILAARVLRVYTINASYEEQITVDELTVGDYLDTLFSLVRQYGNDTTMSMLQNKIFTVEVIEILQRMNFSHIREWTIKGADGEVMPLSYSNYIGLPHRISDLLAEAISSFTEG